MQTNLRSITRAMTAISLVVFITPTLLLAQTPGTLDPSFGTGGKVVTQIGSANEVAFGVAIQRNGKIVAVGNSNNGTNDDFAVVRYNADGTLDNTFGTGGKVTTPVQAGADVAQAVLIQPDGKILVGGQSVSTTTTYDWAIVRYDTNGVLDNTFGTGGKVITPISSTQDYMYAMLLQPSGKIVGVGYGNDGTRNSFALARYNTNGTLDNTFGTSGIVFTSFDPNTSIARGAAMLPNGNIVVVGNVAVSGVSQFGVVMYDSNGVLVPSFGTGGKVQTTFGTVNDIPYSVVVQPSDSKIIVGGYSRVGTTNNFAIARYNTNGTLDNTFGTGGKTVSAVGTAASQIYGMTFIPNLGTVAVGYGTNSGTVDFAVALYGSNGALVNSWGTSGIVFTPFGSGIDQAWAVTTQADGKIVVAGLTVGTNNDFALARYYAGTPNSVEQLEGIAPRTFALEQNYPNPFNPTTKIRFRVHVSGKATLKVYDVLGKEITTLFDESAEAGKEYLATFDAEGLVSGVYFARLQSGANVQTRKMFLLR